MSFKKVQFLMNECFGVKVKNQSIYNTDNFELLRSSNFKSMGQALSEQNNKYNTWRHLTEGKNVEHYYLNEDNDIQSGIPDAKVEELGNGGIITFSTDVNAVELSNSKIVNFIKQKLITLKQRLMANSKLKAIFMKNNIFAFSIGNFFTGSYQTENKAGETIYFSEKSLSVKIAGIDSETLGQLALEIAQDFLQESVIVEDLNTHKTFLVYK